MPIYEYECQVCKRNFEELTVGTAKTALPLCPSCGSGDPKRLISSASVIRSPSQRNGDRVKALTKVNPTKPQEVARHFKEHGSRFGGSGFRGKKVWRDAVDRVAEGGPTLEDKKS
jgi:putative FmdB family regulatory protein